MARLKRNAPSSEASHRKKRKTTQPEPVANRRYTRSMTTAARQAVFHTYELLEHVISFLPARNIFVVQGVCKTWQSIIGTSPSIREKVFLRLRGEPREEWAVFRKATSQLGFRSKGKARVCAYTPAILNSVFEKVNPGRLTSAYSIHLERREHAIIVDMPPGPYGRHFSLMETYISDPPCRSASMTVKLYVRVKHPPKSWHGLSEFTISAQTDVVEAENGIRFGDLMEALHESPGPDSLGGYVTSVSAEGHYRTILGDPLKNMIHRIKRRQDVEIELLPIKLCLYDTVLPSASEWASVNAEEEGITSESRFQYTSIEAASTYEMSQYAKRQ